MNCDFFSTLLSIISLVITVVLGVGAIVQSRKYNKEAEKINEDTKYMIVQQIRMLNELDKGISINKLQNGILNLNKDKIKFHKLSMYSKTDIEQIKDAISHLNIKGVFINRIVDYLKSDNIDYQCDFWGKAEADEVVSVEELYEVLLEYNILISIVYH